MKSYDESYLSDAMRNLGDMVDYAINDLNFDPDLFFEYFITSGIADKFGHGNPKYIAGLSGIELAEVVLRTLQVSFENRVGGGD